jgi:hypothetical protein
MFDASLAGKNKHGLATFFGCTEDDAQGYRYGWELIAEV